MKTFSIVKSINRNTGELRRWTVFSQGKRRILVKYLWGKFLWDELNLIELSVFWHLSEVTSDRSIYLGLKALTLGVSKKLLRERLSNSPFNLFNITRKQYLSIKGRVNFFFLEETVNLRTVPKFSGYTKHHKDKGSLGPEREEILSQIFDPITDVSDEIILKYLTVGEFSLFLGEWVNHPEDAKKQKRYLSTETFSKDGVLGIRTIRVNEKNSF